MIFGSSEARSPFCWHQLPSPVRIRLPPLASLCCFFQRSSSSSSSGPVDAKDCCYHFLLPLIPFLLLPKGRGNTVSRKTQCSSSPICRKVRPSSIRAAACRGIEWLNIARLLHKANRSGGQRGEHSAFSWYSPRDPLSLISQVKKVNRLMAALMATQCSA